MVNAVNRAVRVYRPGQIQFSGLILRVVASTELGSRPAPLSAQFQFLGDGLVAAHVHVVQIIQQTASLADHHQQPAPGSVILLVLLQMFRQVVDALRQQRNLHIRRTGIPLVQLKTINRFRLCFHTL
jgi:hypothetical protein